MKILFTTNKKDAPSTIFNAEALRNFAASFDIELDFYNGNYENYDIVLFMGYDFDIEAVKDINPKAKVGVIDPRPPSKNQPIGSDFIIANGIEMKDWYSQYCDNTFLYYIYPLLNKDRKKHIEIQDKLVIGYHGNKIHLQVMYPRITDALNLLAKNYSIELWAMYNFENNGKVKTPFSKDDKFSVKHIQWSEHNYYDYLSKVDIGLVPNLMPIEKAEKIKNKISGRKNIYNEHSTDYLLRFKSTSNPGRIFVFAQLGIPVVADMFPSSLQVIYDGHTGYIAYNTASWYNAFKELSDSCEHRTYISGNMYNEFQAKFSPEVMNNKLFDFLNKMIGEK